MACHCEQRELRVMRERRRDRVENPIRCGKNLRRVVGKLDLLQNDDAVDLNDDASLVLTTIFVFEAVVRLGLVRALVFDARNSVVGVFRVWGTSVSLQPYLSFGVSG